MRIVRLSLLALALHSASAQEQLLARLPSLMDSAGIPGMALAFVVNGNVTQVKGFGTRSVNDKSPVDENTVFEAASLSKPVVAYIALKLVDAGRLDLNRPIHNYIDISELKDRRAASITTRMVLSHTTGLQNEQINDEPLALAFNPGEKFSYSGEGFRLLQRVLESITGESLNVLAKRLVFDPLGMTRSSFVWKTEFANNAAIGHGDFETIRSPTRPTTPRAPSSLHTTAYDYALFVRAIMTRQGLKNETFNQMMTPQIAVAPGAAWGLGWAIENPDSERSLLHWGDNSNSGFTSFVLINPVQQRAVLYFTNSTTGLGILRPVISFIAGKHPSPDLLGYEAYDAPSRKVRHAIEEAVRLHGATQGLKTYDRLKKKFDSTAFPENLLNGLGYRILSLKRPREAVILFRKNVQLFPRSSNAFDSLGDGLAATGDKKGAIASYLKSYELDPRNEHALNEVKRLRANR